MDKRQMHRSTERVLDIIELLSDCDGKGYSLSEIAERLNAPKSSLFPIVHTMADRKYLSFNEQTSKYNIGYKMYCAGNSYIRQGNYLADIYAQIKRVVSVCLEACHFAILDGGDVYYILKEDSPQSVRMFSSPGRHLPAYGTALGKALLSDKTRDEIQALYPGGLKPITARTITNMDRLMLELEEVRKTGFATECEESTEHIRCLAVPVKKDSRICAAISVAIPLFRYSDEKEKLIKSLLLTAKSEVEKILEASNGDIKF